MNRIRLFIPSPASRFFPDVSKYLKARGIQIDVVGRKLYTTHGELNIYYARGFDIPQLVAEGWGDVGITGLDAVAEAQVDILTLSTLGIRYSDVVLASAKLQDVNEIKPGDILLSEYHVITARYLEQSKLTDTRVVHITGAAEGLAHLDQVCAVFTLKTTGTSIIENGLTILETVFRSQACLIANKVFSQAYPDAVEYLLKLLA